MTIVIMIKKTEASRLLKLVINTEFKYYQCEKSDYIKFNYL